MPLSIDPADDESLHSLSNFSQASTGLCHTQNESIRSLLASDSHPDSDTFEMNSSSDVFGGLSDPPRQRGHCSATVSTGLRDGDAIIEATEGQIVSLALR
jgi:hypothetical protein